MKRQLLWGTLGALVVIVVTSVMTLTPPGDLIARDDKDARAQLQDGEGNPVGRLRCGKLLFVESFQALNYSKNRKHTQAEAQAILESKGYLIPRND